MVDSAPLPKAKAPAPASMVMLPRPNWTVAPAAPSSDRLLAPVYWIWRPSVAPKLGPMLAAQVRAPRAVVLSKVATSELANAAEPVLQFAPLFRLNPSPAPIQVALAACSEGTPRTVMAARRPSARNVELLM